MLKKLFIALGILLSSTIICNAQIFYKIEGNGLKSPSYIFGTHHLAPLSVIDSIPCCRDAFKNAEQVVGEIDMTLDQMALAMKMQPYMMAPQDSTLSKVIKPEDFKRINEEFKKWAPMPGMELSMLEPMRPMVVTAMVAVQIVKDKLPGFNPTEQLDTYFQLQGKETGKKVKGLETPEFQAQILYCAEPISKQAADLIEMLDDPQKNIESAERLNKAYLAQDLETLYKTMVEDEEATPEYMERIVNSRNSNWIKILPGIMSESPSFIAVGALHLPGDKGVVEGLRKLGYKVTPIK